MDDPYLLPGTNVLRNLAGITDPGELVVVENRVTRARIVQLSNDPLRGTYDLARLQAIHRHIFQDIYDWAGQLRTVNISKGNTPFAFASALVPAASELFTRLRNEKNLQGLGHAVFVSRAAHYLSEINALHPFREGNGRAQRAFLAQLARDAGWTIDWHPISEEQNIRASVEAFGGNENAFAELLGPITTPSTTPLRVVPPPTS